MVVEPANVAVTFTDLADTPSAIEVWTPEALSASTDRSIAGTLSPSVIVNDVRVTETAAETEPVMSNASDSPAALSSTVVSVNVPDPDDAPAAITTSKVSSPAGIE